MNLESSPDENGPYFGELKVTRSLKAFEKNPAPREAWGYMASENPVI